MPNFRHMLETLRLVPLVFWDGAISHEDQRRSLKLMGEEVNRPCIRCGPMSGIEKPAEFAQVVLDFLATRT